MAAGSILVNITPTHLCMILQLMFNIVPWVLFADVKRKEATNKVKHVLISVKPKNFVKVCE